MSKERVLAKINSYVTYMVTSALDKVEVLNEMTDPKERKDLAVKELKSFDVLAQDLKERITETLTNGIGETVASDVAVVVKASRGLPIQ